MMKVGSGQWIVGGYDLFTAYYPLPTTHYPLPTNPNGNNYADFQRHPGSP